MWTYQGTEITSMTELPNSEALFGFVYKIFDNINRKTYIGRKNFHTVRKKKLTKKEISTDKRLKTYKSVKKEGTWMNYWGSNKELLEQIKLHGEEHFTRKIIEIAYTPKQLTFLELQELILNRVLFDESSYNDNILGKFFRRDLNLQ